MIRPPRTLFSALLLCSLSIFGTPSVVMAQMDEADPLARTRTLLESSEIIGVWGAGSFGQGAPCSLKIWDYLELPDNGNDPDQIRPGIGGARAETDSLGVWWQSAMQIAVGNLDGLEDGNEFDDVVAAWEGPNSSINVFVPDVNEVTLSWSDASRLRLPGPMGVPHKIELELAEFDLDQHDEILVAYAGADSMIYFEILETSGTLVPEHQASFAAEPFDWGSDFSVTTGDLDGDRDHEIILVGYDPDWNGPSPGTDWGLYAQIYDVVAIGNTFNIVPMARTLFLTQPSGLNANQVLQDVVVGDFDRDTIDEIAVVGAFFHSEQSPEPDDTFVQLLSVSDNLMTFGDPGTLASLSLNLFSTNAQPGISATTGDLNLDGRDELVFGLGPRVYVYEIGDDELSLLTLRATSSHGIEGNADYQYSNSYVAIANVEGVGSESQDNDRPEIVSVYNRYTGGVNDDQYIQLYVHGMGDFASPTWSMTQQAEYQDEVMVGGQRRHYSMAVGDFDGDRIRVGTPNVVRKTELLQPLVIVNAPPVHFDVLGATNYDVNQCFNANQCEFSAAYEQTETRETGITTEIHADWTLEAGAGAEGDIYGIKIGASVKRTYGEEFSNVRNARSTEVMRISSTATEDDVIYATVSDYDVWEYPVYADGEFRCYLLIVDPRGSSSTWIPSKAPETASLYRPDHEVGNILSYRAYTDSLQQNSRVSQLIRGTNDQAFILNDTSQFEWELKFTDFSENQASVTEDVSTTATVALAIAEGKGTYEEKDISTHRTTVTEELSLLVNLGQVDLGLGSTFYRVTPYTYWSKDGTLVLDYAVRPELGLPGEEDTWWDTNYGQKPDPAFLMRWRYEPEKGRPVSDRQRQRTNQISFDRADLIPGETVNIRVRVHNLSLVPTAGPVTVRLFAGDPDEGGIPIVGNEGETELVTPDRLLDRESATLDLDWTIPSTTEEFIRVYGVIDPDDGIDEIHTNNNKGWAVLGLGQDIGVGVALSALDAVADGDGILLSWAVRSQTNHAGFHVWRAAEGSVFSRLTTELITQRNDFRDGTAVSGVEYGYRLEAVDNAGSSDFYGPVSARARLPVLRLALTQNVPNPFNPLTTIRYEIPAADRVILRVYDLSGRLVNTLVDRDQDRGAYQVIWDGRDDKQKEVGSGVYVYRLEVSNEVRTRKMVVIR